MDLHFKTVVSLSNKKKLIMEKTKTAKDILTNSGFMLNRYVIIKG